MNTVQSPMLPANCDGHPATQVTYQPTYITSDSGMPRSVKIMVIIIIVLAILGCILVTADRSGLFNLLGEESKDFVSTLPPGWSIECQFTNKDKTEYITGEIVSGTIEFFNSDDPELKFKKINIILVGEVVYNVSEKIGKTTSIKTYKVVFFQQDFLSRTIGNDSGISLPIGRHTWSFSGLVDHLLLSSIDKTDTKRPLVHYFVRIEMIQIKWHKRNIYKNFFINVQHNSSPIVNITRVEKQEQNRNVHIHVTLPKNHVVTGTKFIVDIDLHNSNEVLIYGISASLVQIWDIRSRRIPGDQIFYANQQQVQVLHRNLEGTQSFRGEHFHRSFELLIPRTIPPTCSIEHPSSLIQARIVLRYELLINVQASGFFSDIDMKIPVIVSNMIHLRTGEKILSTSKNESSSLN
ncbi:unnamed protein product [Rotaria magnacalcarata]|uniref:Arrestin C-terminal-like domain-containing protein n=1 Tax=Rotaria magnacalcarata TaxID=392030 RepID=A0A816M0W8_9BILA|nr:unnamed protein product [Rotaria magnacalcarata]CAF4142061.1 unnamed protein product [Rotaria magnacalcarata]